MRCDVTLITAIAVGIVSVRASAVHVRTRAASARTDPFVECMRQTHPHFPKEGNPTAQELQTCFNQNNAKTKRQDVLPYSRNKPNAEDPVSDPNTEGPILGIQGDVQVKPRSLADTVTVLQQTMSIDHTAICQNQDLTASTLHDEFVWAEDVAAVAVDICKQVQSKMEETGINEDGGSGFAYRTLTNAHDKQGNSLANNRELLFTVAVNFFPPAKILTGEIKDIAQGVNQLCAAGIERIITPTEGCTEEVKWYDSKHVKNRKKMAAMGGQVGLFFGSANSPIGGIRIGFLEDTD